MRDFECQIENSKIETICIKMNDFFDKNFNRYLARNLSSSYYQNFQPGLIRILRFSRLRFIKRNKLFLLYLQRNIAKNLSEIEKAISYGNTEINKLEEKLLIEKNENARNQIRKNVENYEIQLFANKNIRRVLRSLADGIAWRNLKFDRSIIRLMAENKSPGHIDINQKGFQGTLSLASLIVMKMKSVVIVNDLTNFIRIGDLVEIGKEGIFVHEIKKRGRKVVNIFSLIKDFKKKWGISSQSYRLLKVQTAVTHKKIVLKNGKAVSISLLKLPFKNHLKEVLKIIKLAKKKGFYFKKINDYLSVSCSYILKVIELANLENRDIWKDWEIDEGWNESDEIVPFQNFDFYYKSDDYFVPNMTPYTVFPFPAKICIELLNGNLQLVAKLNISEIYKLLKKNGWTVIPINLENIAEKIMEFKSRPPNMQNSYDFDETVCILKRGVFNLAVPSIWIFRIAMDFMSVETLIEELEEIYSKAIPFKNEWSSFNILGEQKIWR